MRILFFKESIGIDGDPMGVMQLSAIAKAKGAETDLCTIDEDYLGRIERYRPDLIAISLLSTEYGRFRKVIVAIKARHGNIPMVLGGSCPTFVPSVVDECEADAVCVGEGDYAFPEIMDRVGRGADFRGIPNIHMKDTKMPPGRLVEDLDTLPFIDREIVYNNSAGLRNFRMRSFFASRGCPYSCTYCFNHAYNRLYQGLGRIVRRRSVDNLLDEVAVVVRKYPTEFVKFADDVFTLGADDWLREFAAKYPRRIGIPFYCLVRPNNVDADMVKLLKEAGCGTACMSIETASDRLSREVVKRNVSKEQIIRAFDLVNEAGINTYTNSILGFPTATREEELETLDLNIRCRPSCGLFSIATPFPGTELHRYCVENNLIPESSSRGDMNLSTGEESMLTSFTGKEKRFQRNLSLLGPLVIRYPLLKRFVVGYLLGLPTNALFILVHYLTKMFLIKKYIVPIRYRLFDYPSLVAASIKAEMRQLLPRFFG